MIILKTLGIAIVVVLEALFFLALITFVIGLVKGLYLYFKKDKKTKIEEIKEVKESKVIDMDRVTTLAESKREQANIDRELLIRKLKKAGHYDRYKDFL